MLPSSSIRPCLHWHAFVLFSWGVNLASNSDLLGRHVIYCLVSCILAALVPIHFIVCGRWGVPARPSAGLTRSRCWGGGPGLLVRGQWVSANTCSSSILPMFSMDTSVVRIHVGEASLERTKRVSTDVSSVRFALQQFFFVCPPLVTQRSFST